MATVEQKAHQEITYSPAERALIARGLQRQLINKLTNTPEFNEAFAKQVLEDQERSWDTIGLTFNKGGNTFHVGFKWDTNEYEEGVDCKSIRIDIVREGRENRAGVGIDFEHSQESETGSFSFFAENQVDFNSNTPNILHHVRDFIRSI